MVKCACCGQSWRRFVFPECCLVYSSVVCCCLCLVSCESQWLVCCIRLLRWGKDTDLGIHKGYFDYIISADWCVVQSLYDIWCVVDSVVASMSSVYILWLLLYVSLCLLLLPNRQHLSGGHDCLKDVREDYKNCFVLYCIHTTVVSSNKHFDVNSSYMWTGAWFSRFKLRFQRVHDCVLFLMLFLNSSGLSLSVCFVYFVLLWAWCL